MRFLLTVLPFLFLITTALAQRSPGDKKKQKDSVAITPIRDTTDLFIIDPETQVPLTINLEAEDEEAELEKENKKKKKKKKKNVFYGLKTKKGFSRKGAGENSVMELFRYLKNYEAPDPYVRDVYWYDTKRKQIRTTHNIKEKKALILHGPYKKITDDGQVLEEGMFYKGTKHGRWTSYNKRDILMGKNKYTKGWPRESEIEYYDEEARQKIKEVVPIEYGEEEGYYFYFHPGGRVAVEGEYQQGKKVGLWTEYYDFERRPKKQIKYPDDPYDDQTKPYISKEWNPEGQVVYDHKEARASW